MKPIDPAAQVNLRALVPNLKVAERCRGCNFTINLTPDHRRAAGKCPGCQSDVCFLCGCTEEVPCGRPVIGGYLPCSWYAPGCCTFCFESILEQAYIAASTSR